MFDYIIYTDGACSGNPGPGGWGAIITKPNDDLFVLEISGGEANTTNNRMELTAVIQALKFVTTKPSKILVVTDSKYIVDAINQDWITGWISRGWRKSNGAPTLNSDLWADIYRLLRIHTIQFQWVKGHIGHPQNERCDQLARAEVNKMRNLYV